MIPYITIGCGFAFLSVALGAFGAHGLEKVLSSDLMKVYETANRYLIVHALALVLFGILKNTAPELSTWIAWSFIGGCLLFSGSLYLYVFTGSKIFAMITPIGGLMFLLGWLLFGWCAWKLS